MKPIQDTLRIVQPGTEPKSGCLWCPLLSMSEDFEQFRAAYQRDADKIVGKLKEPHTVHSRKVSESWTPVDILFVGEAPSVEDDNSKTNFPDGTPRKGKPFVGASGGMLRRVCKELFTPEGSDSVSITWGASNVVRCRPPMNRDPGKTEIQCCTPELDREIAVRKPRVIVPLGNHSLKYLTGREGITAVAGTVMQCRLPGFEHIRVVPCLHPAYVLRFDHELQRFCDAIGTAGQIVTGAYEERAGEGQYYVLEDVDLVEEVIAAMRADKQRTAMDTETGDNTPHRDRFPRLLCVSLSNAEGIGYAIPLDHAESPWALQPPTLAGIPVELLPDPPRRGTRKREAWEAENEELRGKELKRRLEEFKEDLPKRTKERVRVMAALKGLFEDSEVSKVGQNWKFDAQFIRYVFGCELAGAVADTMLTHLTIDDRRGTHGLEVLSYTYTGMGGYHKELDDYVKAHLECDPEKGGSYANIPGRLLFRYAAQDSDATLRVLNQLQLDPLYQANPKFQRLAEDFFPRLSKTLSNMEYAGAQVDPAVVQEMAVDLQAKIDKSMTQMKSLPQVKQFVADRIKAGRTGKRKRDPFDFNPGSDRQVGTILWEYYGAYPVEVTDSGLKTLSARYKRLSKDQPGLQFSEVIDRAVAAKSWEMFSTKADVLHEYERAGIEFAPLVLEFRESQKLLSTYVEPLRERLDPKGRIHGSFWITGTTTGRLCVDANTLLDTDKGTFRIADLQNVQNVHILTHRGRYRKILDCFFKGREEMFRVELDNGAWVECTKGHRLWTPQGFRSVQDIRAGDAVFSSLHSVDTVSKKKGGAVVSWSDSLRARFCSRPRMEGRAVSCDGNHWPVAKVVSVESVGVRDVWDLGVEEDESYVAQGLIHHNSSAGPNLQNIPQYAKRAYVSQFGPNGLILSADYSQIELRVAASLFNEPSMIQAYLEGADLHMLTAIVISGMPAEQFKKLTKEKQKWWRTLAKRVNFGIVYGIGAVGLVNTLKKEGVFITIEEAKALLDKFFASKPALVKALQKLKEFVLHNGYLESFTGRVRRLPEVMSSNEEIVARALRQAGNFPVQGGAGDITLMSLVLIDEEMRRQKMQSELILTVHDSIGADTHVDEMLDVSLLMRETMQNIPFLSDQIMPGIDWAWLKVPLIAEFEVGVSWGQAVEFDPIKVISGSGSSEKLWWEEDGNFKYRKPESVDELFELIERKAQ